MPFLSDKLCYNVRSHQTKCGIGSISLMGIRDWRTYSSVLSVIIYNWSLLVLRNPRYPFPGNELLCHLLRSRLTQTTAKESVKFIIWKSMLVLIIVSAFNWNTNVRFFSYISSNSFCSELLQKTKKKYQNMMICFGIK